jgi:hypothetical protein
VKKYFPPASTFHGCFSEICTKPASLNLCLASSVATQQQQSPTTTPPEAEKNLRHPSFVSKARENPRKIKPKKIRLSKTKSQAPPKPNPEFCGRETREKKRYGEEEKDISQHTHSVERSGCCVQKLQKLQSDS